MTRVSHANLTMEAYMNQLISKPNDRTVQLHEEREYRLWSLGGKKGSLLEHSSEDELFQTIW